MLELKEYPIPEWVLFNRKLEPNDRIILALLIAYDPPNKKGQRKGWVTVSQKFLSDLLDMSRTTMWKSIQKLQDLKIVEVRERLKTKSKRILIRYDNPVAAEYFELKELEEEKEEYPADMFK